MAVRVSGRILGNDDGENWVKKRHMILRKAIVIANDICINISFK